MHIYLDLELRKFGGMTVLFEEEEEEWEEEDEDWEDDDEDW